MNVDINPITKEKNKTVKVDILSIPIPASYSTNPNVENRNCSSDKIWLTSDDISAEFIQPGKNGFAKEYYRNYKRKGQRNLRCFVSIMLSNWKFTKFYFINNATSINYFILHFSHQSPYVMKTNIIQMGIVDP